MIIRQISVPLQNTPGTLSKVSDLLGDERVDMRALMLNYGETYCTLRMVVDKTERAIDLLKGHGYEVDTQEVIAVETPDHPGGLNAILKPFKEAGINVLYLYPFIGTFQDDAILIIGVDCTADAIRVLQKNYIRVMDKELFKS